MDLQIDAVTVNTHVPQAGQGLPSN